MRVLVTGAGGQLGKSIERISSEYPSFEFLFTDLPDLDITREEHIQKYFRDFRPGVVINCAAYTNVDKAEEEPDKAMLLNEAAVSNLCRACESNETLLVHISTDYVFNGRAHIPYVESDPQNPASAYGISKANGEKVILGSNCNALILRTSWLYSEYGHNFLLTMLRLSKSTGQLKVVYDQIGTPTYAGDLAGFILEFLDRGPNIKGREIYHFSNEGVASWYDFAMEIMEIRDLPCQVIPVTTSEYPRPAERPPFSLLSKQKVRNELGITIPHWKSGLKRCLKSLDEMHGPQYP